MHKRLLNLLSAAVVAAGGAYLTVQPVEAQSSVMACDTLSCNAMGCCIHDSSTGKICDCEKWDA